MDSNNKLLRQNFYTGHNGSSVGEVILVTGINQWAHFLLIVILSLVPSLCQTKANWFRYLIEYVLTILPFVLVITYLSDNIQLISLSIISLIVFLMIICFYVRPTKSINIKQLMNMRVNFEKRLPFLTSLMSTLVHQVCVAILAVDFPLFSRRFAKTEIYGWSLMDVGVGSFVAANGGFSPESRLGTEMGHKPMFLFKKTLLSTIPLIVLGFQRLIAVKSLDYYEHITEYGLHWNFFFTLALTKLFSTTFCCLFTGKVNIGLCGAILLAIHQICLSSGLSEFIQNDDRNGLIAANKEGIISLMGYISLYLFFVQIGKYIIRTRYCIKELLGIGIRMILIAVVSGIAMLLSHEYIENVSRREVNLAFVLWMVCLNCIYIGLEFFFQSIIHCFQYLGAFDSSDYSKSILFTSIGYNGMLLFLFANLLTGLVNLTIDTISAPDWVALLVLVIYTSILSFVSVFCQNYKIQLKFPMKQKSD